MRLRRRIQSQRWENTRWGRHVVVGVGRELGGRRGRIRCQYMLLLLLLPVVLRLMLMLQ